MSIFAGVLVLSPSKTIPSELMEELRTEVSRHSDDAGKVQEFTDGRVFMAKLDLTPFATQGINQSVEQGNQSNQRAAPSVLLKQTLNMKKQEHFAREFLNYGRMRIFIALLLLRRNEYAYLLHAPEQLHRYWGSSSGAAKTQGMQSQQKLH